MGDFASKCNTRFKKTHQVDDGDASDSESEGELYGIYTVTDKIKEIKDTLIIMRVCEVLKVKHAIADSMVVYFTKSKNCTHFLQSGQVFEIQGCNGIACSPF